MSKRVIQGNDRAIYCLLEKAFTIAFGGLFELVHDGGDTGSLVYSRVYQMKDSEHPGQFLSTYIRFTYDLRTNFANIEMDWHDIASIENKTKKVTLDSLFDEIQKQKKTEAEVVKVKLEKEILPA